MLRIVETPKGSIPVNDTRFDELGLSDKLRNMRDTGHADLAKTPLYYDPEDVDDVNPYFDITNDKFAMFELANETAKTEREAKQRKINEDLAKQEAERAELEAYRRAQATPQIEE